MSRTHIKSGAVGQVCNPSVFTETWEEETSDFPEVHRSDGWYTHQQITRYSSSKKVESED